VYKEKHIKYLLALALLTTSIMASADTKITVGGTMVRDSSTVATVAFDHLKEYGPWQHSIEGNYIYNEKSNVRSRNEGYFSFKENYALDERSYAIGSLRYDYDEFRSDSRRTILAVGYGYKILKTDTLKISNEFTLGQMNHTLGWQDVATNSLWLSYKVAKRVTLVNKFLVDWADQQYVRNKTELNYQFDEGIVMGISNLYTKDPEIDNITTFSIGTTF
jgi:putative salt-induced outer membrane protein YdiY